MITKYAGQIYKMGRTTPPPLRHRGHHKHRRGHSLPMGSLNIIRWHATPPSAIRKTIKNIQYPAYVHTGAIPSNTTRTIKTLLTQFVDRNQKNWDERC